MDEFAYELKIPKERVAVLIGKDGEIKKKIEEETKSKIDVDSKEGDVEIQGENALLLYCARDIVRAIGRGFNPDVAMLLLKQDYSFELISVSDYVGENHMVRIKGRVIGKDGKSRKLIEEMAECSLCVYGKTVGIIGTHENIGSAKRAVESLLSGSTHSAVYKFLERRRRDIKKAEF
ncbi:RNA-processing protein [Candidatus Woesearchaeota archaeon]|nr:RNA-processing protein [Candidatus Woesearchaeota archaeon]